jgi:lipocalin
MKRQQIKKYLKEARNKGWWIACFYWERKLEQLEQNKPSAN